jgi:sterol-4alpha-carboxylate 3-dehydrogenase (decarboxylating)
MSGDKEETKLSTALPSVLIVGGNGFLGRRLPAMLSNRHPNCRITVIDIAPERASPYDYYQADITKLTTLIEIFDKVKPVVVIHSATPPIPTSGKGDSTFFQVNVDGTRNVITACQKSGVQGLVYTSSASVVHDGGDLINVNENTPYAREHVDPYNASKVNVLVY